jgi:N-acyl-D-glutamate deacylase
MPWTVNGELVQGDVWPLPPNAFAHPRGAGTFTRFLRRYVRERNATSLRDALGRMTIVPARILESSVPAMRRKGRVQLGADADLVAFDLATVSDQATYAAPNAPARGMRHVLVGGVPLIRDGALDTSVRPGRPIRRPVTAGAATGGGPDPLR